MSAVRRLLLLVAFIAAVAACGGSSSEDGVVPSTVVAPAEASAVLAAGDVTLVDVRTPAEFAEGRLAGAVSVDYEAPDFDARIAELPRDAAYVVYCRSGSRSAGAAEVMARLGFEDVIQIDGGIVAWEAAGRPIER